MAEKRGRGRPASRKVAGEGDGLLEVSVPGSSLPELEQWRLRLRSRWEMASVLNFLHVFQPIIQSELRISAEEIESALITPNNALVQLHITLLKGIPPVSKNLAASDVWVTVLCRKLTMWWPWVAEGEVPLVADHGLEISKYKELDPTTRLLILKALCEIRVQQDDILRYIDEEVKLGDKLSMFRKDSIGGDDYGTAYWHDGDSVIGHRLYRNIVKVKFRQNLKEKGRLTQPSTQPSVKFQWETLATNLEEFREISDKLSSSKIIAESAVGNIVKIKIMPALEQLQKKKERALKRRQREEMLLEGLKISTVIGSRRSCRDRRHVSYTFDEYERSIDEALQTTKKVKRAMTVQDGIISNGSLHPDLVENEVHGNITEIDSDDKHCGSGGDDNDDDYDEKNDDGEQYGSYSDDNHSGDSGKERANPSRQTRSGPTRKSKEVMGLRRSMRTAGNSGRGDAAGHVEMKKRLRQRPTRNTDYTVNIISDSEDGSESGED